MFKATSGKTIGSVVGSVREVAYKLAKKKYKLGSYHRMLEKSPNEGAILCLCYVLSALPLLRQRDLYSYNGH